MGHVQMSSDLDKLLELRSNGWGKTAGSQDPGTACDQWLQGSCLLRPLHFRVSWQGLCCLLCLEYLMSICISANHCTEQQENHTPTNMGMRALPRDGNESSEAKSWLPTRRRARQLLKSKLSTPKMWGWSACFKEAAEIRCGKNSSLATAKSVLCYPPYVD